MLRAVYQRVIIKPDPFVSQTASGLFAVDTKSERRPVTGTVVSVGPGDYIVNGPLGGQRKPMTIKVGDRVRINKYGGNRVEHEGELYIIVDEEQVLCIEEAVA